MAEQYPIEAEEPIVQAMAERSAWIKVSPTAIATAALSALHEAGWRLVKPAVVTTSSALLCTVCGSEMALTIDMSRVQAGVGGPRPTYVCPKASEHGGRDHVD